MKKSQITLIISGFILLALMATNPSIEDHRQAVMNEIKKQMSEDSDPNNNWEQVGQAIGMAFGQGIVENVVTRDNYFIFSITKISFNNIKKSIGYGALGNVYINSSIKEINLGENSSGGSSFENDNEANFIRYRNLDVMKNDLEGIFYLNEVWATIENMGEGWRVPNFSELHSLYVNKDEIPGFSISEDSESTMYLSSTDASFNGIYEENEQIRALDFKTGEPWLLNYCCTGLSGKVRLVRDK